MNESRRPEVSRRLRDALRFFPNRTAAARAAGVGKSSLQRWLDGESDPSFEGLASLAETAGISLDWLAYGRGNKYIDGPLAEDTDQPINGSVVNGLAIVPRILITDFADYDPGERRKIEGDYMGLHIKQLRRLTGAEVGSLVALIATGEGMAPTIRSGDLLFVNVRANILQDEGVYVIGMDETWTLKRLQRIKDQIEVRSDNATVARPVLYTQEEFAKLRIAGRVVSITRPF